MLTFLVLQARNRAYFLYKTSSIILGSVIGVLY